MSKLSDAHWKQLHEDSAIARDVIAERGYRTITSHEEGQLLDHRFADRQIRLPSLAIPIYRLGEPSPYTYSLRADDPRADRDGKRIKYEFPTGVTPCLDVLPRYREALRNPLIPLWFTEGAKKADALASLFRNGIVPISLNGVYGWRGTNEHGGKAALPDFEAVAINSRRCIVAFDSDVIRKLQVWQAVERLAAFLLARQAACVEILILPQEGDQKLGVDDAIAQGMTRDDLLALVRTSDEARKVLAIASNPPSDKPPRKSQATQLVDLATSAGVELFHTPEADGYATIPVDGHTETWPLRVKGFRQWLERQHYLAYGVAAGTQAVQDALGVLQGKALYDGDEHPVFTRIAEHDGRIYLDLANERWEVVTVTPDGWQISPEAPVKFRRTKGMAPLPRPMHGGSLETLRSFLNIGSEHDWTLLVAWLVAALRPRGPYPILALHGEQGSAKSTAAKVLRSLIDPSGVPLRAEPREERDLAIAAGNTWVLAFDNLSRLPNWLSDALCRLSTGGGFATRELYSDRDEALFDAMRPVLLTGIEDLATRSDLLDRTIVRYLPAIPDERRRTEASFWQDFEAQRPALLGALLSAVSTALANLPGVTLPRPPRLADFAYWVTAAEPALGWKEGTFVAAYEGNRGAVNDLALDASPVAMALCTLAEKHQAPSQWEGTPTELLAELAKHVDEQTTRGRDWPKTGQALSGVLRRFMPNLRANGVAVEYRRENGGSRRRLYSIRSNVAAIDRPTRPTRPTEDRIPDSDAVNVQPAGGTLMGTQEGEASLSSQPASLPSKHGIPHRNGTNGDHRDGRDDRDSRARHHSQLGPGHRAIIEVRNAINLADYDAACSIMRDHPFIDWNAERALIEQRQAGA